MKKRPPVRYSPNGSYEVNEYKKITTYALNTDLAEELRFLARKEMSRQQQALDLPEPVVVECNHIYSHIIDTGLVNNFSIGDMVAGSMYTACREEEIPQSFDDFLAISRVKVVETGSESTSTKSVFNEKAFKSLYGKICDIMRRNYLPLPPVAFLNRYCEDLDIEEHIQEVAKIAIQKTYNKKISGVSPHIFAASSLYYAMNVCDTTLDHVDLMNSSSLNYTTIQRNRKRIAEVLEGEL